MNRYSTRTAAKKLGIHFVTLKRYIAANKVPAPKSQRVGGSLVRAWTEEDVERGRKVLPKIANGRKTRSEKRRKRKKKTRPQPGGRRRGGNNGPPPHHRPGRRGKTVVNFHFFRPLLGTKL